MFNGRWQKHIPQWLRETDWRAVRPYLAIIVVELFVALALQYQRAYYPADQSVQQEAVPRESSDDRLADYTLALTIFTAVLAAFAGFQLWILARSDRTARMAADAAKTGAEAAVAALDRPWLFLDMPIVNYGTWIEGKSKLEAAIYLNNYGKAPAFVHGIMGLVFISPARRMRQRDVPFDLGTIDALEFPLEADLAEFMRKRLRSPDPREGILEIDWRGIPSAQFSVVTTEYIVPFVVPGGDRSLWYLIRGKPPIADLPPAGKGMPLQGAMEVYMIGRILYSGPDEELQVINFCYEQGPDWRMRPFMPSPYNHRYKLGQ